MKQIIVIVGTIILGVFIFNLIIGDEDGSLKASSKNVMVSQVTVLEQ